MTWAWVWLFVVLKIPVVAACLLVWWAVRAVDEPEPADGREEGGGRGPHGPRPRRPRPSRRGSHAGPAPHPPRRVRNARGRTLPRVG